MVADAKHALRKQARVRRPQLARAAGAEAGVAAASHFLKAITLLPGAVVSGYWPVGDEFDVRPLLERLHAAGHACALPVVVGKGKPLVFRRWEPGDTLVPAALGIPVPLPEADELVPDVLLVPMLAFDGEGYRLGYGGGFYDLTLASLREAAPATLGVGAAYSGQRVAAVPHEATDERLDWILTEQEIVRVGGR
ncbi:MAG: 5-formyltetrahydrofolate cyclo-ligase [Alphaproteobacteria bacterium]